LETNRRVFPQYVPFGEEKGKKKGKRKRKKGLGSFRSRAAGRALPWEKGKREEGGEKVCGSTFGGLVLMATAQSSSPIFHHRKRGEKKKGKERGGRKEEKKSSYRKGSDVEIIDGTAPLLVLISCSPWQKKGGEGRVEKRAAPRAVRQGVNFWFRIANLLF